MENDLPDAEAESPNLFDEFICNTTTSGIYTAIKINTLTERSDIERVMKPVHLQSTYARHVIHRAIYNRYIPRETQHIGKGIVVASRSIVAYRSYTTIVIGIYLVKENIVTTYNNSPRIIANIFVARP